jgi:hypothetical protein
MYFTPDVTDFMLTVRVSVNIAGLPICSDSIFNRFFKNGIEFGE